MAAPKRDNKRLPVKRYKPGAILYCGVVHCKNSSENTTNVAFFSIPTMKEDPERRAKWLVNIGRSDILGDQYRYVVVCEKHFENKYKNFLHFSSRTKLTDDAIPTLHLMEHLEVGQIKMEVEEPSEQTASKNQAKSSNILEDHSGNIETSHLELSLLCAKYLSKPLNCLTNIQVQLKKESKLIHTEQFKEKVIGLYLENDCVYEVLQSSLGLPPVSDLPSFIPWKQEVINEYFFKMLKSKVDFMSQDQVYCTLCVSLINIQPNYVFDIHTETVIGLGKLKMDKGVVPLKYALVAMVRGIFDDWQQVVAFSLLEALEQCDFNLFYGQWLDGIILKLFESGLNLKVVISDNNNFLIKALAQKRVSDEKPFFFVNGKKIVYIFDVYSLIMLIFNYLKNTDSIRMPLKQVVKWGDILSCYENDKLRKFRVAPKLTEVRLNQCVDHPFQKERIDISHVLSLETAVGISTFVDLDLLNGQAMGTAQFIMQINQLKETSDSNLQFNHKPENIFSSSLFNKKFLKKTKSFFKGLKLNNDTNSFNTSQTSDFVDCCLVTLENLHLLYETLKTECNKTCVTRYLNQDPLTDFLDRVRTKKGIRKDPTTKELMEIMKETLIFQKCKIKIQTDDCIEMKKFTDKASELTKSENIRNNTGLQSCDYDELKFLEADSLVYVAMTLLNKIKNTDMSNEMKYLLTRNRMQYERRIDKLKNFIFIPNNDFVQFVEKLDKSFILNFESALISGKVVDTLMKKCNRILIPRKWRIIPSDEIKRWFIFIRIFHTLKVINEMLKDTEQFTVQPLID